MQPAGDVIHGDVGDEAEAEDDRHVAPRQARHRPTEQERAGDMRGRPEPGELHEAVDDDAGNCPRVRA